MGCGSSKAVSTAGQTEDDANIELDVALAAYLSAILGIAPKCREVQLYVSALRAEGCYTSEDFEEIPVDELKEEPFCFKRLDLKKIARSRAKKEDGTHPVPLVPERPVVRGQCALCGLDVFDSQPRLKDHTGLYQHENCTRLPTPPPSQESGVVSTLVIAEAKADAAKAAADAHLEVAAIKAAADAARADLIAEAKRQAEAALAQAKKDATQIAATAAAAAAAATPVQNAGSEMAGTASERVSTVSGSTGDTQQPSSLQLKPVLAAGPKSRPLLPEGKHAFLSYQWDVQREVKEIKELLNERRIKCWMDIDGGMKSDIYDSMAEGVAGAACIICFMTQAYQDSANCKLELKFAQQSGVPIIPV